MKRPPTWRVADHVFDIEWLIDSVTWHWQVRLTSKHCSNSIILKVLSIARRPSWCICSKEDSGQTETEHVCLFVCLSVCLFVCLFVTGVLRETWRISACWVKCVNWSESQAWSRRHCRWLSEFCFYTIWMLLLLHQTTEKRWWWEWI